MVVDRICFLENDGALEGGRGPLIGGDAQLPTGGFFDLTYAQSGNPASWTTKDILSAFVLHASNHCNLCQST